MSEGILILIHLGETKETDQRTEVFAEVESTGRDEFVAAGQKGYKATKKFVVWANEYDNQPEAEYNGKRFSIYRTYGPRKDDKIELYAAERIGNYGRNRC